MKITKYIMMLAAAVGMAAACQQEEFVVFHPEDVIAPVLHEVEDVVITEDNLKTGSLEFTWDAADFGFKTEVLYSVTATGANGKTVNFISDVKGTSYKVTYEKINGHLLYDFEIPSGEAGEVTYTISAKLRKSDSFTGNQQSNNMTPIFSEKVYAKMWVVGSYNGWAHDASNLFLYDYAEEGKEFQGVIDFGESHAENQFKITGGGWGNDEHSATGTQAPEGPTVDLVLGGGDNITAFTAKRYYHLTFDKSAPSISMNYSFDQVGIIGLNGDWNTDIVMDFSKSKQRFYKDIEVAAATEFKFRMDADWAVNFGGDINAMTVNGGNIPVAAGNYRVYFDMNNLGAVTCTLDERMYGKEEGTTDSGAGEGGEGGETPDPVATGWALIGDFNGWGADLAMTQNGAIWSVTNVDLVAGQGFKIRKDADWADNRGATGDVEPYQVTVGEAFEVVNGGKNLTVPADGAYDIYYDSGNEKMYVLAAGSSAPAFDPTWFLVGGFNSWTVADAAYMMKKEGEYFVFKGFTLESTQEVKFNAGGWDVNRGGDLFSADAPLSVAQDGANLKVNAGSYDVYLTLDASVAYFMTDGKTPAEAGEAEVTYVDASNVAVGFSGTGNSWGDPTGDFAATFVSSDVTDEATYAGTYTYELASFTVAENDEFKVRIDGKWIGAADATVEGIEVSGTDNFLSAAAGTFKVTITFDWDGLAPSNVKAVFAAAE